MEKLLPAIPAKRYFTIGEVSDLCGVKPYVLRYWEQEFTQLKPMKRRGNRRYYQHHEVLLVRRIRELLYDQGFTISGARNRLSDGPAVADQAVAPSVAAPTHAIAAVKTGNVAVATVPIVNEAAVQTPATADVQDIDRHRLRVELLSIRDLLTV